MINTFLGVFVGELLVEINIGINRMSIADCPSRCGWALSNPLQAWIELDRVKGLAVFELEHQLSSAFKLRLRLELTSGSPGSQAFGLALELYQKLSWVYILSPHN